MEPQASHIGELDQFIALLDEHLPRYRAQIVAGTAAPETLLRVLDALAAAARSYATLAGEIDGLYQRQAAAYEATLAGERAEIARLQHDLADRWDALGAR